MPHVTEDDATRDVGADLLREIGNDLAAIEKKQAAYASLTQANRLYRKAIEERTGTLRGRQRHYEIDHGQGTTDHGV